MPSTALKITETVSPSAIGGLRRQVARAIAVADTDVAVLAAVRLCVSEALTNVVMHGYPEQSGLVELSVELEAAEVVVTVRDAGCGLGGSVNDRRRDGGLGLELIGKLTDGLRLTSESDRGTEIRMTFLRDAERSSAGRFLTR
jgi:anti-sigma regulatory factor (Ser/Thr protein kinase)